jgi:hypothetical protein
VGWSFIGEGMAGNLRVFSPEPLSADLSGQSSHEIPAGTVIYKEAGKLYMVPGNEPGAQTFQNDFDISY